MKRARAKKAPEVVLADIVVAPASGIDQVSAGPAGILT